MMPLLNSSLDPVSDGFTCQAETHHTSRHGRTIRAALYRLGCEACACARSDTFNVSVDFRSMRRHLYLLHLLCTPLLKKQPRSRVTSSAPLLGKQLTTS
jgi:hypothetical protein